MDESVFVDYVADHLAALPGVLAVTLGGSRATGTHGPASDWDFAVYYREHFDPGDLRDIGWQGTVSEIGGLGRRSLQRRGVAGNRRPQRGYPLPQPRRC